MPTLEGSGGRQAATHLLLGILAHSHEQFQQGQQGAAAALLNSYDILTFSTSGQLSKALQTQQSLVLVSGTKFHPHSISDVSSTVREQWKELLRTAVLFGVIKSARKALTTGNFSCFCICHG